MGAKHWFERQCWNLALALPLIAREALDNSLSLWKPQFTQLQNGEPEFHDLQRSLGLTSLWESDHTSFSRT